MSVVQETKKITTLQKKLLILLIFFTRWETISEKMFIIPYYFRKLVSNYPKYDWIDAWSMKSNISLRVSSYYVCTLCCYQTVYIVPPLNNVVFSTSDCNTIWNGYYASISTIAWYKLETNLFPGTYSTVQNAIENSV